MTLNQRWAAAIVDTLILHGVRHAVVAPGSRSTPLALLFAERNEIEVTCVMDERSAAFVALGISKASMQPVALLCTSGSAGAHFLPALTEASASGIPLIVFTADRPWELHEFGAPQTMNQKNLFGSFVRRSEDLPAPEDKADLFVHLVNLVNQVLQMGTNGIQSGPVHFNVAFREPLAPEGFTARSQFVPTQIVHPDVIPNVSTVRELLNRSVRPLIICGPRDRPDGFGNTLHSFASSLNIPVLAEASSNARYGFPSIAMYETWLRDDLDEQLKPDLILKFGGTLTSKFTQRFVDSSGAKVVSFVETLAPSDAAHSSTMYVHGHSKRALDQLQHGCEPKDPSFLNHWKQVDFVALKNLDSLIEFNEPGIAHTLVKLLGNENPLMVSSSMPIRDVDAFAPMALGKIPVFANRCVNGIDGIVSTAVGIAKHTKKSVAVLIGDVALLHDVSAWIAAKQAGVSLVVVVVNNDGGGIFHFLPVAQKTPHFETLFGTPHGANLKAIADLVGANFTLCSTLEKLSTSVLNATESGGLHLIECQTSRHSNVDLHRNLFKKLKGEAI
jgi:2-succinyl-5-enolpyruvyl-6-hydroxy-3-cyclohexene-1-carboxylate synthase